MKSKIYPASYACNYRFAIIRTGVSTVSFTGIARMVKEENTMRFHIAALKKCTAFISCCNDFYNRGMLQPLAIITAFLRMIYQSVSSFLTHLRFIAHHHFRSWYEHRCSCIVDGSGCAETNQVTGARSWRVEQKLHFWELAPLLRSRFG